ncbi:MAG: Response regulator rcp1 [Verrucomicrobiae bacterium]|nr:Response regulator rcp1 [Verrucomicrobiae bacterium]
MRKPFEILLVEDNPADVEITLEAFRRSRSGNHVAVCRDGEEALDFLFQRGRFAKAGSAPRPDLVLLDLNLPRKSGIEILMQIKTEPALKDIPIVVLTTSDRDDDVRRSYQYGANSYLTKPVQFDDCVKLIADIQQYWLELSKLPPR